MKKIPTLKTKKAKVEFIREIQKQITAGNRWSGSIHCTSEDFYELSRFYKVYKSIFLTNPGAVPYFLTDTLADLKTRVLEYAIGKNIPKEDLADAVQFDTKGSEALRYDDLRGFLHTAMGTNSRLTLASQLRIIDIVRDSCEPS